MAELKNIRIAVSGLYDYALEEIPSLRIPMPGNGAPEWVEEKRLYKVYRPAPVLAAACKKFANLPLTHHHPKTPVDGQNFRNIAIGWTGESPEVDYIAETDEVGIKSTCMLYDDEALQAYENGEVQLSPGYIAVFEWQKGQTPRGEEYDIIMKEITDVNHLALLPAGRGGEYAVVLDNAPEDSGEETVFNIVRKNHGNVSKDGAPKGNDNASKDHVNQDLGEDHPEYKGLEKAAINFIAENKGGQVKGAYHRYDVGDIDIAWGEVRPEHKGFGLAHIIDKHGEKALERLDKVLKHGSKHKGSNGKIALHWGKYIAILSKDWGGEDRHVVLSGFFKDENSQGTKLTVDAVEYYTTADSIKSKPYSDTITDNPPKIKTVFEIVNGSVFDRVRK